MQGLFEWLYGLFLNCISFTANALLGVMSTDLTFFETYAPIVVDLYDVFTAVGWALLLGNLVFQALKVMFTGLGFETESPVSLLSRSAVFGFLLLGSKQICLLGLSLGEKIINLMGIPELITLTTPDANLFTALGDASWVLVIIVGTVLGFQLIKLFFEIGERYVIVCVLTLLAPLGFAMGGSKATKDIATGYIRMFASMVLMMVLNVLFLKLVLSALATMPTAETVIPWCVLVVALARTARKVDNLIARIGLNPAITGDPLSHRGGATALMMLAARSAVKSSAAKIKSGKTSTGAGKSSGAKSMSKSANKPSYNTVNQQNGSSNRTNAQNSTDNGSSQISNSSQNNAQAGFQNTHQGAGSQRNGVNNTSGKNSQTTNVGGQKSNNAVSSDSSSKQNSNQNSNMSANSKINQGGAKMGGGQKTPTQVNSNRFGNSNSSKNSLSSNQNNNSQSVLNQGKNNVISNQNSNPHSALNQGKNSIISNQNNNPQSALNQGKNSVISNQNSNSQSALNQGKSNVTANQNSNPQSAVNQGKNNLSANPNKNAQPSVNQGKNNVSTNPIKNTQPSVNQGKNNLSANPNKNAQPSVNQGKNNLSANPNKNAQPTVNQGNNQVKNIKAQRIADSLKSNGGNPAPVHSNTTQQVRTPQTAVLNGKNETKPIAVQDVRAEPTVNNEVENG